MVGLRHPPKRRCFPDLTGAACLIRAGRPAGVAAVATSVSSVKISWEACVIYRVGNLKGSMSFSQYHGWYGNLYDGHGLLYRDYAMGPARVLVIVSDPCPIGLLETLSKDLYGSYVILGVWCLTGPERGNARALRVQDRL